jgi:hypothetical protein
MSDIVYYSTVIDDAVAGVSTLIPTYSGPGDVLPGAIGWWGLRAYNGVAVGKRAVNLRRDSDNATQDFSTLANGSLDTASITTFKGSANLFITKLYDQVGSNDMVQATAANQIPLVLNGIGLLPIASMNSTNLQQMASTSSVTLSQPITYAAVCRGHPGAIGFQDVLRDQPDLCGLLFNTGANPFLYDGTNTVIITLAANTWVGWVGIFNGASSVSYVNALSNSGTLNATGISNFMETGTLGATNRDLDFCEFGFWSGAFSGQASAMISNQRTYWGF